MPPVGIAGLLGAVAGGVIDAGVPGLDAIEGAPLPAALLGGGVTLGGVASRMADAALPAADGCRFAAGGMAVVGAVGLALVAAGGGEVVSTGVEVERGASSPLHAATPGSVATSVPPTTRMKSRRPSVLSDLSIVIPVANARVNNRAIRSEPVRAGKPFARNTVEFA